MIRISILAMCVALFWNQASAQTAADGRRPYQARSAGYHGEDGAGGGHGPNIVEVRRPRATSQNAVRDLILKGIPDGGMPPFQIPIGEADAIAAFVMTLKTPVTSTAAVQFPPGDPKAGERFFAGKGNCTACHMVRGVPSRPSGVLGQDLTAVARDRKPDQIEQKLRDPETTAVPQAGRGGRSGPFSYRGDPNSEAILATGEIGTGVCFADMADQKPGTWPTYDGNLSGNRFSPLKQISTPATSPGSRPSGCSAFPVPSARWKAHRLWSTL
jgi:mono/diheme cytochrome c family protein